MSVPILTAVTGPWEASLVAALERGTGAVVVVRRCADLTELLAAAAAGQARAVLLSADLRRLDRAALDRLAAARVAVVGLADPRDDRAAASHDRLRALGIRHVLPADASAADVSALVTLAVREVEEGPAPHTAVGDPTAALPRPREPQPPSEATTQPGDAVAVPSPGQLVAVWGPAGAPGRTTVAVTLAAELAAAGHPTLLADADTYAASVAQVLALLDEAPGIAAACRAAASGHLDPAGLARLAPQVAPDLRVLTGITRSSRWPELPGGALEEVWRSCRWVARWTVVDVGAVLEADEELSFDTAAPRRNAATLTTLETADVVLAVGSADPIGLQRLVRGLQDLAEVVPTATPRVVVTRVRASAVGPSPRRRVADALARYAGVEEVVIVPDDRGACDAALLAGRTLTEAGSSSPARVALADLAATLTGQRAQRRRRRSVRLLG